MITIALIIVALMCDVVIGVVVIRHTIGEGIGILIGDGFPMWFLYVAILLWPISLVYYLWILYGPTIK